MAADRELNDESIEISARENSVLENLGDSLPKPLDFVFDKPLSVSDVSETLGFGDAQTFRTEAIREQRSETQITAATRTGWAHRSGELSTRYVTLKRLNSADKLTGAGQDASSAAVKKTEDQKSEAKRADNLAAGINDSFLDPNMKVEDFIKRFEIESREVFACRTQILAAIQLKPGMAVADVGSGTGLYLGPLSKGVGEEGKVYAIDISPKFAKHLRDRAKEEKLANVEVVLCSDRDVHLKANSIDRAFICDVYHHFEYPESSLISIHRAMRAGGKLILKPASMISCLNVSSGARICPFSHCLRSGLTSGSRLKSTKFEEQVAIDGFSENYLLRFSK